MSNEEKSTLKESLIVFSIALLLTTFAGIYFSIRGYPLVTTFTGTLAVYTPPLYMIPVFFPYGILLGEIVWLWVDKRERFMIILLFIECLVVGLLSFIRYIITIPFSGHAIIIFFFLFHQGSIQRIRYPLRFMIGLITLLITVIFKLFVWNDPLTFLLGALVGIGIWFLGYLYREKRATK
jgi:hypothetical protein